MKPGGSHRAFRALCAALFLCAPCLGDWPDDAAPAIRRIYVPASAPDRWPVGPWEPIPLADLESQLANRKRDQIESQVIGLERAEYQAKFEEGALRHGTLEWKFRQSSGHTTFASLDPLNLAVSRLEWRDVDKGKTIGPVVWGTAPSQTSGLVLPASDALAVGTWSLVGRRMERSTEFEVRVPPAMVSRFRLLIPEGFVPTSTAGVLTGPRPAPDAGFSFWELHLGSRASCRLRLSPPLAETARRALVIARTRTNFVVRPEVVHVLAEFDLEMYETAVSELRLQADEGLQVVGVEYGDDVEVEWRVIEGSDGRAFVAHLPESLTGAGQMLRVIGIAPGNPRQPWNVPRIYLPDAVEAESQVTLRFQPPYQAADLRMDGYRQTELVASPTEGEKVVLRQLKPGASLTVVPSSPRLSATCRSVSLARLEGEEWGLTALLELQAMTGSAFDVSCRIAGGWEVVSVQSDSDSGSGDLAEWEVVNTSGGESRLQLEFSTALSSTRPQRVRVAARRDPIERGSEIPIPAVICPVAAEIEAVAIVVSGPDERPLLQRTTGWEMATLADLSPSDQLLDFVRGAALSTRSSAVVLRANRSDASGTLLLHALEGADPSKAPEMAGKAAAAGNSMDVPETQSKDSPLVGLLVSARVQLAGEATGFDDFQIDSVVCGPKGAELSWSLPKEAENVRVFLDGRSIEAQTAGNTYRVRLPESALENHGRHNVSFEYRIPFVRAFGPSRRQIALPRMHHPILGCRWSVSIPRSLRLVGAPLATNLLPANDDAEPLLGALSRNEAEPLFNPFDADDWRRLERQLAGTEGDSFPIADRPRDIRDGATGPKSSRRSTAESMGELWSGSSLNLPDDFELTVWDRKQAVAISWAGWFLSLLTTGALRMTAFRRRRLMTTIVVGLLTGAIFVFPSLYAQFAGSMLLAVAVGALLPERLLLWRGPLSADVSPSVPSGSTRTFATASLLSVLFAAYVAYAQDDRTTGVEPPSVSAKGNRELIDVLVPTDADGRPAGDRALCYVSGDVLKRLHRLQSKIDVPPYLLNAAALKANVEEGRQVDIRARFDVYVLSEAETVRVELPLTNVVLGGADACLVDGRPHPVMLGPGGQGLVVELEGRLERPSPVPLPTTEVDSSAKSSPGETPAESPHSDGSGGTFPAVEALPAHQIELRVHALLDLEANEAFVARLGIPVVSDTSVDFAARAGESVLVSTAPRAGEASQRYSPDASSPSRIATRLRPTGEVQFRWSRNRTALQAPPVELTAYVSGSIDASPALAIATYQVDYRVHAGAVDSLVWKLPHGSTLVSVQSPGLSGFVIESGEGDARRLFLEFAAPQSGNIVVMATLAQPMRRGSIDSDLPLLEVDGSFDRAGHTTLGRFQMAFQRSVDFGLKVSATTPGLVLKHRTVDDFLADWRIMEARPQQAYELIRSGILKLTLEDLPGQLLAKTESRGRFARGKLDWTFQAEIEPPVVPPFQYRLRVDPRLRIRKVTVQEAQEDGADRLLRWSHENETLILFLNDRAVKSQILRVDATMPVTDSVETDLPQIELEGTPAGTTIVSLSRAPNVGIQLSEDGSGVIDADVSVRDDRDQSDVNPLVARFKVAAGGRLPRFRAEDAGVATTAEISTILQRVGSENFVTAVIEYRVRSGRGLEFGMELPSDLAQDARIETSAVAQTIREPAADGRVGLRFFPAQPVADRFRVVVKAPVVIPFPGDWTVPVVSATAVPVAERCLILPREYTCDLPQRPLPERALTLNDSDAEAERVTCYRQPPDDTAAIIRAGNDRISKELPETFADVSVETDSNGLLTGRYVLWLPNRPTEAVAFDWPPNAEPIAVFFDDRPQPTPAPADGVLTMPVPVDGSPLVVCIQWVERGHPPIALAGEVRSTLPVARNVPLAAEHLTMKLSPRLIPGFRPPAKSDQRLQIALDRWEAGLNAIERQPAQERDGRTPWLVGYLEQSVAAVRLAGERGHPLSPPQRRRIEALEVRTAVFNLADARDKGEDADVFAAILSDRLDGPQVGDRSWSIAWGDPSPSSAAAIRRGILVFNRSAVEILLGSCVGLLFAFIIWKTSRFWRFVQQRDALAWIFLGLFWWLTMKGGAFGLALIVWGSVCYVRQFLRPREQSSSFATSSNV